MGRIIKISILVLLLAFGGVVKAQKAGSPYSSLGIGLLHGSSLTYSSNMGGLGLSNGNSWILNNVNPAMLPVNTFTTFDLGMSIESRNLSNGTDSRRNTSGNLAYLAMGFPIKSGKWTMSVGLMPYSSVNYKIQTVGQVIGKESDALYQYTGEGGINRVYLASGWKIFKQLYFGIRASYLFGSIIDESYIDVFDTTELGLNKAFLTTDYYEETRFSDFVFEPGLLFVQKLNETSTISIGAVYELKAKVNTYRTERLQSSETPDFPIFSDTLVNESKYLTTLPQKLGIGISYNQAFKWTFGADFYIQNWSVYKNYRGTNDHLNDSYKIIVGGEYLPDYQSVNSYLKRVTYQMGFSYEKTPFYPKNTTIEDFGINFGVSLPVGRASVFNIGFNYGQMGTTDNGFDKRRLF